MTKTLEATFDGKVLQFNEELDLEPNTVVRVTIETIPVEKPKGFLAVARSLNMDGPEDWSENFGKGNTKLCKSQLMPFTTVNRSGLKRR